MNDYNKKTIEFTLSKIKRDFQSISKIGLRNYLLTAGEKYKKIRDYFLVSYLLLGMFPKQIDVALEIGCSSQTVQEAVKKYSDFFYRSHAKARLTPTEKCKRSLIEIARILNVEVVFEETSNSIKKIACQ